MNKVLLYFMGLTAMFFSCTREAEVQVEKRYTDSINYWFDTQIIKEHLIAREIIDSIESVRKLQEQIDSYKERHGIQ